MLNPDVLCFQGPEDLEQQQAWQKLHPRVLAASCDSTYGSRVRCRGKYQFVNSQRHQTGLAPKSANLYFETHDASCVRSAYKSLFQKLFFSTILSTIKRMVQFLSVKISTKKRSASKHEQSMARDSMQLLTCCQQ